MGFDFKIDPFDNFLKLYKEAQIRGVPEANAMALATVSKENQPSVRIVLFKGLYNKGFSFFTNYDGRKARDLESNSQVAATFFWPHLDQQIRIEGRTDKLSRSDSEAYFATRSRLSQIGAWASNQSEEIPSFESFQTRLDELELKFKNQLVPCPPHWGGYRIDPSEIEFWFGRPGRLHERYIYQKQNEGWRRFLRSP